MWEVFGAAGGGFALTFIVLVAVAVFALAVLYIASAMVVLERFARTARKPRTLFGCFIVMAVAGAFALDAELLLPGLLPTGIARLAVAFALFGGATALAMFGCRLAVTRTEASARGTVVLVVLGVALALWLGSTGRAVIVAAPALAFGVLSLAMAGLRRRRAVASAAPVVGSGPSRLERQLRWVVGALGAGAVVSVAIPGPTPELAQLGEGIFGAFVVVVAIGLAPLAAAGLLEARHSAEWFIAVRYLLAKRRQVFISAITAICVVGIAAGVWLIIIVLSVMNGFEGTWREEILGNRSHFTIHSTEGEIGRYDEVVERVRAVDGVVAASPYIEAQGMVRGSGGEIFGVQVRGIDPQYVGGVTDLPNDIVFGSLDGLSAPDPGGAADADGHRAAGADGGPIPGIVIGDELSAMIGATLGGALLLISPFGGAPTPLGPAPRLERFRVVAIYRSSFFQYDEVYTYVSIPAAQSFRRSGDIVDGIEVRTTDFYRSKAVGERVASALGSGFFARDWKEFFPAFFQALKTERVMMFVLLTMIVVVAAFLIVATLVMMIMEKSSDIAILKAMGAEDESIERIFAIEGTLIGLAGTAIGIVAGIAVTGQLDWIQDRIEAMTGVDALPSSVYQLSTLPSEVDPVQVAVVTAIALVFSLGATVLPSRQGARLDPAEGLRYE